MNRASTGTFLTSVGLLAAMTASAERQREGTEWSITYWYEANQDRLPRVLLIGDSICNGYQSLVKDELRGVAYTSFYATSKCVTDRSYLKELAYVLDEYEYAVIHFNNGLHSLDTDRAEWEKGLRDALALMREKETGAQIVWATSTPLKDPELTRKAKELNAIAGRVMEENGIPVNDLFALMDPQDRDVLWTDTFHYNTTGRKMQAEQVAAAVRTWLPPPPPVNAVKNPGFEKEGAWGLYVPKGKQASFDLDADSPSEGKRAARVTVVTNGHEVQLYQHHPNLTPGKRYRISYQARADKPGTMKVNVRTQAPPYAYYGGHEAPLTTEWNQSGAVLELPEDYEPGKCLLFFCFTGAGSYWLDDVRIEVE